MNLICIMLDSFRQDHFSLYNRGVGPFADVPACVTPEVDAFAEGAIVFDNAYPEGLPTIPVRTALMTGQYTLPFREWIPLTPQDVSVAEILRREDYTCGIISDCYHYRAPGMNFHRGFHTYDWVRGQEYDPWRTLPPRRPVEDYVNDSYNQGWRQLVAQFLANTDDFREEADWFPAQVVARSVEWLERNRDKERVFLWIDSFEPHEPWDPPAAFDRYTDPGYSGKRLIMPKGGRMADWASEEEIREIRGLYAGEAHFVGHCLGPLFEALERLGYYEDSLIFLVADHGHPLGDHGKFLKGSDRLYNELLRVPFIVRLPGGRNGGLRPQALVQFQDVLPTFLDIMGLGNNTDAMQGRSFRPVLEGDSNKHREAVIVGYKAAVDRCIRDERWSYIQRPEGEPDELYDLTADPREQHNLIDEHPEEAARLSAQFGPLFRAETPAAIKGIQARYELDSGALS